MNHPDTTECPLCDGTGWRPVEKGGVRLVESCPCQTLHRERNLEERANIPPRYHQCGFENFDVLNQNLQLALLKAKGFVEQYPHDYGLLFLGNPGVGKTHLAVGALKELMARKGVEGFFCSFQELLQQIRESYNPVSLSTESGVLQPILHTEVVVIDDLGANRVSDWVEDTVTYILNYRYNQQKPIILTSNLPDGPPEPGGGRGSRSKYQVAPDTLTDRIGTRVRSRLHEMCKVIKIESSDYRQNVHAPGR